MNCKNCRYWSPDLSLVLGPNAEAIAGSRVGECRRNAPRGPLALAWAGEGHPMHSAVMTPFPITHVSDWCGEWQSSEPI